MMRMVFIMPVFQKIRSKFTLLIAVFAISFYSNSLRADFKLINVDGIVDGGLLQVDAQADLSLSQQTREALDSGVDLRMIFLIELMKTRNWIWDTPMKSWEMLFTLHFHQLSGQYILAIPQSDNIQAFNSIEQALEDLASRLSFNLGYERSLELQKKLYLRAKIKLDTEYLPAPLKLFSLVSGDWKLDSGWKEWALEQ